MQFFRISFGHRVRLFFDEIRDKQRFYIHIYFHSYWSAIIHLANACVLMQRGKNERGKFKYCENNFEEEKISEEYSLSN